MTEEEFIIGPGGRKILVEYLRLDRFDRDMLHTLLTCFARAMDWPKIKTFHNETLNTFIDSVFVVLDELVSTGKMESVMSDGMLIVKAKVIKVEERARSIGQYRSFLCTDKSVRIDAYDRNIIVKMMDCMNDIVVSEKEEKYFIPMFHHRTLKKFITSLYKIFFETDKLRHFNNCVDKNGNMYISTMYAGK
jgi:hypothetical protein